MIEIDGGVVNLSTKYLPEWQDCSSIARHDRCAEWCFDDERADLRVEDALAYFNDNFGSAAEVDAQEQFDVLIMDCLDPNDDHPFAKVLYTDDGYVTSLYDALTEMVFLSCKLVKPLKLIVQQTRMAALRIGLQ
eukprot:scaffold10520_cov115-Skeletonema_dohrnii-CCMP3373.AAC.1